MPLDRSLLFLFLTSPHHLPTSQEDQLGEASNLRKTDPPLQPRLSFLLLNSLVPALCEHSKLQSLPFHHRSQLFDLTASRHLELSTTQPSSPHTGLTTINKMSSPVKARAANTAAIAVENEIDVYSASHIYYGPDAHHKQHNHFRTRTYSTVSLPSCILWQYPDEAQNQSPTKAIDRASLKLPIRRGSHGR